jgi:hypothetical protein
VGSQTYLGGVLLCLGFPNRAFAQSQRGIVEAQSMAHSPSRAVSLSVGTLLLSLIGDDAALAERADQLAAVAAEQGFPH